MHREVPIFRRLHVFCYMNTFSKLSLLSSYIVMREKDQLIQVQNILHSKSSCKCTLSNNADLNSASHLFRGKYLPDVQYLSEIIIVLSNNSGPQTVLHLYFTAPFKKL